LVAGWSDVGYNHSAIVLRHRQRIEWIRGSNLISPAFAHHVPGEKMMGGSDPVAAARPLPTVLG